MRFWLKLTALVCVLAAFACLSAAQTLDEAAGEPSLVTDRTPDKVHPAWQGFEPEFTPQVCPFSVPGGYDADEVQCGYVLVPEDRTWAGSRLIRLYVLVIKSTSDEPPLAPIIRLTGGPGGPSLSGGRVSAYRSPSTAKMREAADLVFFDQRGVGHSESEFCRALPDAYQYGVSLDEGFERRKVDLAACLEDARAEGVAVEGYTNWQNALDVRDIRLALGYDRWNLFGVSYGTELGQAVMQLDPDGTHAAILDSPVPAGMVTNDLNLMLANGFRSSLDAVNEMCAADAACARAIPDLVTKVLDIMAAYDADPLKITGLGPDQSLTGDMLIDGSIAGDALFQALYRSDVYPSLPAMLAVLESRDTEALKAYVETLSYPIDHVYGDGMQMVINCRAGWQIDPTAPPPPGPDGSVFADYNSAGDFDRLCDGLLDTSPDPTVQTLVSDIPTLVVTGLADPITPPYYADQILPTLSNGQRVDFPYTGHGGIISQFDACGQDMLIAFFTDPMAPLDTACTETLNPPEFVSNLRQTTAPYHFARGLQSGQYPIAAIAAAVGLLFILVSFLFTPIARQIDGTRSANYGRARTISCIGGALALAGTVLSVQTITGTGLNHPATLPFGVPSHIGVGGWIALVGTLLCGFAIWRAFSTGGAGRRVFGTLLGIILAAALSAGLLVFLFSIGAGPF